MGRGRAAQPPARSSQSTRRWFLNDKAPGWFRRTWTERSREVPQRSAGDPNRLRRITDL